MPQSTFEKFLPASGILAGVLFAVSGFAARMPSSDDTLGAMGMIRDHQGANAIAMVAGALCAAVLVFFAAGLRGALRSGEGAESSYSSVAHGGAILLAAVMGVSAWVTIATLDAAGQRSSAATDALGTLAADSWVPFLVASAPMLLAVGLGGLRAAALPKWLAITSIVLGVLCFGGPTGFLVFLAMPLWLVAVGVVLSVRQRAASPVVAEGVAA